SACSSSNDDAPPSDVASDDDAMADDASAEAAPYPAPHFALPTVYNLGGPIIAKPKIVPIFYPGFAYRTQILDFAKKLGASAHWQAQATEYGVGAITVGTPIDLTTAAPSYVYDSDIRAFLTSRFDGTHPEFGNNPDQNSIYTFYYPSSTTIAQ